MKLLQDELGMEVSRVVDKNIGGATEQQVLQMAFSN
ncbi:hypothetical protein DHX103_01825 [Planococcus sp. X10-3]